MPQLDVASFRPQVAWLTLSFGVLYRAVLNFIAPLLAGILQTRELKSARDSGALGSSDAERRAALAFVDAGFARVGGRVAAQASEGGVAADSWQASTAQSVDAAGSLASANKAFLLEVGEIAAARVALESFAKTSA